MYQVWTKDEFEDRWRLAECETLNDVKEAFLESMKQDQPTMVTQRLEVSVSVEVVEAPAPAAPSQEKPLTERQKREREAAESEAEES